MVKCLGMRTLALVLLGCGATVPGQSPPSTSAAVERVLRGTHGAAMVVDVVSGRVLASYGAVEREAAPGSTLKPFVLRAALETGAVSERATVACRGTLMVKGHNLTCVHPRAIPMMDAREALQESCNNYFARVAGRMGSGALVEGLRTYGLRPVGAVVSQDERVLLALGVEGIRVSPKELAEAYRRLALEMTGSQRGSVAVVRDGLMQSVETGMAHGAHTRGVALGGKTGTADGPGGWGSHGWFAGVLFNGATAERVIVVFVPDGNGNDAAGLARRILAGR